MMHILLGRLRLRIGLFVLFLGTTLLATPTAVFAATLKTPATSTTLISSSEIANLTAIVGRSHIAQDPTWIKRKLANLVRPPGNVTPLVAASTLSSKTLNLYFVNQIAEPPPVGTDIVGKGYNDSYFAYFCGPGATDVAMTYWSAPPNLDYGQHTYTEPSYASHKTSTTWNDTNFRSYLMYIADQVKLPGWSTPGEVTFDNPSRGIGNTFPSDLRDTMNWEASGHSSSFSTFFFLWVPETSLSQSTLHSHIADDINIGYAPVVNVRDDYLPSWKGSPFAGQGHSVAIVGYDDTNSTYTYIETCTPASCGTQGAGFYTISQSALYQGIIHDTFTDVRGSDREIDGGIVW